MVCCECEEKASEEKRERATGLCGLSVEPSVES